MRERDAVRCVFLFGTEKSPNFCSRRKAEGDFADLGASMLNHSEGLRVARDAPRCVSA
jgi:hypothetical protein